LFVTASKSINPKRTSRFFNNAVFDMNSGGVSASSENGPIYTLDFEGSYQLSGGPYSFYNIAFPIQTFDCVAKIHNTFFQGGCNQISVAGSMAYPLVYDIRINKFEGYRNAGIFSGLEFLTQQSFSYSNCFISDNIFNCTFYSLPSSGQLAQSAILLQGVIMQNNTSVHINGNHFVNATIKNGDNNYNSTYGNGISLSNVSNAIITDNTFNQLYPGPADTYQGMNLVSSNHNTISGNTYTGISNSSYGDEVGLRLIDSRRNTIRCNNFSNLKGGVSFTNSCDATGLTLNSFENHAEALLLTNANTVIGQQIGQFNSWPGQSTEEATFSGVDQYSPVLFMSRFVIPTDESNDPYSYWPSPKNPSANWFVPPSKKIDTLPVPCIAVYPAPTDNFSALEQSLIGGALPQIPGYPALEWDVKFDLYDLLFQNEGLHPVGSHVADFFDANATTNLGQLYQAYLQYTELSEYTSSAAGSSIQSKQTEVAGLVQDIKVLLEQERQTTNVQTLQQLQSQYTAKIEALQTAVVDGAALIATYKSGRLSLLNGIYEQLNQISPASLPEENMKNLLVLLTNITESGTNQALNSQLGQIADQCRYSGGNAVAIARAALGRIVLDDAPGCNVANRDDNHTSAPAPMPDPLTISPNPVGDFLSVYLPVSEVSGTINIYAVSGQLECSKPVDAGIQQTILDVKTLKPGLYILELQHEGHVVSKVKFAKAN
jgi:hypothetical protein